MHRPIHLGLGLLHPFLGHVGGPDDDGGHGTHPRGDIQAVGVGAVQFLPNLGGGPRP